LPSRDLSLHVKQVPESACVQALIAQPTMEAIHIGILGGLARPDMHYIDLPLDGPGQEVAAGYFRAVVTTNRLRLSELLDGLPSTRVTRLLGKLASTGPCADSIAQASPRYA